MRKQTDKQIINFQMHNCLFDYDINLFYTKLF